ncbi:hypothetical protein BCR33DRAFT_262700 [Rhizoclosmatium globosum]|uniref:Uncharacterized protein n=1 Tax=Rhizoclosmatium globosum TaxID=329046 RepID=A0A1Y2C904_9FUNG|nr:hypothetical protein BCR33DRAFT_262700 [Rhizoclosmatium globosum]|eukprot:ORY43509.1 hypothetical protein BCR33DRAFT_262700 [Rhizoclosmatium globosum]
MFFWFSFAGRTLRADSHDSLSPSERAFALATNASNSESEIVARSKAGAVLVVVVVVVVVVLGVVVTKEGVDTKAAKSRVNLFWAATSFVAVLQLDLSGDATFETKTVDGFVFGGSECLVPHSPVFCRCF